MIGNTDIVEIFLKKISGEKNPRNRPGFEELGAYTPYDLAVKNGHYDTAEVIDKAVKGLECQFRCPKIKNRPQMLEYCYRPDLLEGKCCNYSKRI